MLSIGALDAMPSGYRRHPPLLSFFTAAVEAEIYACFLRGTASAPHLDVEDETNEGNRGKALPDRGLFLSPVFIAGTVCTHHYDRSKADVASEDLS